VNDVFDLKKTAQMTGLSVERLREMVQRGEVSGIQPGGPKGKFFIRRSDVEKMLEPVHQRTK
jgi:hypothetical protein